MADIGHGTTIAFSKSSFTATLRSVSGPSITLDSVDSSHLGTTYAVREFVPGMLDPGEITCEIIFDPDEPSSNEPFSHRYMANGWDDVAGVTETVTITFPPAYDESSGATWAADGFITGYAPDAPMEDLMTASLTIKLSGDIAYTAGS